jgi:hypothetical protein
MPTAQSLRDLLRIRNLPRNRKWLRDLPGCLGTAVGFKYNEWERAFEVDKDGHPIPAILVFVEQKIPRAALNPGDVVPPEFHGPDGLVCHTDVMVGSAPNDAVTPPPPSPLNRRLLRALHETDVGIVGGLPIESAQTTGTAACAVRMGDAKKGLLTNFHVAGFEGTRMLRTAPRVGVLGHTIKSIPIAPNTKEDPDDLESFTDAPHRIDVGLIELTTEAARKAKPGVFGLRPLGKCYELDLDTMGPIGTHVVGVGQTLGLQEGRIVAYGYEWRDDHESQAWSATDYLILSDSDSPFAAPGDSGKLVVTNDEARRPIALLWGGERHDFWNVPAQATCAYANDIGLVLKLLGAEIL